VNKSDITVIFRTTVITIFATICFLPFSIYDILNFDFTKINYTAFISVLYYGTFVSVVSYLLWFKGIAKVPASIGAVFTGIMPASSILLSSLILKEPILPSTIISLVLIFIGICFSCLSFNHKKLKSYHPS
jgi:drug/metabolite transporter (DMT)-like permease